MASQLLINEPPLQVLPSLARAVGLNEAIILQQVHYWLNPRFNKNLIGDRLWVRNTYEQWRKQFSFWGEKTIRRTIANLEELGLLDSFITKDFKKTKYYTINYQLLEAKTVTCEEEEFFNEETGEKDLEETPVSKALAYQPPKMALNQGVHRSGHIDQIELPVWADRRGQVDQIDQVNMTRLYNKDTETTVSENLPPLSPPSPSTERKEEEKIANVRGNANSNLEEPALGKTAGQERTENPPNLYEDSVFQGMVTIWNELVQARLNLGPVQLNDKRKELLRQFLVTVLASEKAEDKLEGWRRYCNLIANSRFLAGENLSGFRVTLDWALKPEKAVKILEGGIYDKPQQKPQTQPLTWQELEAALRQHNDPPNLLTEEWVKICQNLASRTGFPAFKSWFIKTTLIGFSQEKATIQVETLFQKDHLNTHYRRHIEQAIRAVYSNSVCVVFEVVSSLPDERSDVSDVPIKNNAIVTGQL